MRILYFFQEKETPMYQWQRLHFIDELSKHGCSFTFINPLSFATPEEANDALKKHVNSRCYDLFLTNICYPKALFVETIETIKKKGIPTLNFRSDNLTIPYFDKKVGPAFDLLWLTSQETQHLYDKWGIKTMFAPYAANPYFFKWLQPQSLNRSACFIGTPYGSRPLMINALTEKQIPVDVYYKKNKQIQNDSVKSILKSGAISPGKCETFYRRLIFPQGRKVLMGSFVKKIKGGINLSENPYMHAYPSVMSEEQPILYAEHVLALSSTSTKSTDVLRNPLQVINLRAFEIPMSGGIELTKYSPELAEYFEDGKEIVFYRDNDELVEKARYYIEKATDSEILKMKLAARKRAENEHTWWNRFTKAFDLLGIKYNK